MLNQTLLAIALLTGALCVPAWATNTAKIHFEQTVYDFGKTSQVETVTGTFKFKNVGDGVLKIEAPKPSCGCTVASLKPDTLPPGETGELVFTLNLGRSRATMEKIITVKSNDPKTPEVLLTIKVDYTPLYDINPIALAPSVPFGGKATNLFVTITRTDGKPLGIQRLEPSKPWVTAQVKVEPGAKADASTARILIEVQPDGPPRRFNEYVHVYAAGQSNGPVSVIYVYGQVIGDLSLSPEALYWSLTAAAQTPAEPQEALMVRRLAIRSNNGQAFELKNPKSTVPGIHLELVPKEPGKVYELVAKLSETPGQTLSGNVSFETSVTNQPRIEVPVIVNVFKP
jgi:hypothetical protein